MDTILALITAHKFLPLAVLVIGWLNRAVMSDSKFPITIPERYRPLLVLVLGQVYSTVTAIASGATWQLAISHGVATSLYTFGLVTVMRDAIFAGNEPTWFKWIVLAFTKPEKKSGPTGGGAGGLGGVAIGTFMALIASGCSKQEAKTVIDTVLSVTQIACLEASTFSTSTEVMTACNIDANLGPEVKAIIDGLLAQKLAAKKAGFEWTPAVGGSSLDGGKG